MVQNQLRKINNKRITAEVSWSNHGPVYRQVDSIPVRSTKQALLYIVRLFYLAKLNLKVMFVIYCLISQSANWIYVGMTENLKHRITAYFC